jgi:LysR family transcriptional regulator, mexEF-oprN operon transcriptional activator
MQFSENELRRLDLNVPLTFTAIMRAGSAKGAAERLHLGQPAISMALWKLRAQFDDLPFVPVGRELKARGSTGAG